MSLIKLVVLRVSENCAHERKTTHLSSMGNLFQVLSVAPNLRLELKPLIVRPLFRIRAPRIVRSICGMNIQDADLAKSLAILRALANDPFIKICHRLKLLEDVLLDASGTKGVLVSDVRGGIYKWEQELRVSPAVKQDNISLADRTQRLVKQETATDNDETQPPVKQETTSDDDEIQRPVEQKTSSDGDGTQSKPENAFDWIRLRIDRRKGVEHLPGFITNRILQYFLGQPRETDVHSRRKTKTTRIYRKRMKTAMMKAAIMETAAMKTATMKRATKKKATTKTRTWT